ncbi:translesion error-prone DNA polymerase V autoproteolytic subunit [Pseudomonas juntendi]|uniref:LexA family protein n=1 Tax=Pseudomonas TaxID=286 RepID=UPI0012AE5E0D|nr:MULTISPECIES: translesion error-prone DNA polymerase V autoproteolytic subunit [Pseudomonas]MDG9918217.1 translesion error-prone DNA polymerase V autoproteolytic subunit [Pseudomonas juntendi]MDH0507665.1 translesion error-prone DNA polymerase V autoproteolytic subunit [Pseudomonas juntendi]MDH1044853.1 translesion error-prone DNA polymerase V autoproteolytic subunit [Pseudomonas juntendi]MRT62334.1 translesion error-prone DNA polymerase V autoproteolytic subunit [Pseudomonas sp. CAH-1]
MSIQVLGVLSPTHLQLPLYSFRVPAGFPSPAQDHIERRLSLDDLLSIDAPHTYIVRVAGDSMIGIGIHEGDMLVVDRSLPAKHGDVVVAALNGEPLVKRLGKVDGCVALLSENPAYGPKVVQEGDQLEVWGVVSCCLRMLHQR